MFAKNLTSLRKARKLTQYDAAQLLGLHRATYACYEKGKTEPPASVLLKMADCFHVSAEFLMRGAPTSPSLFHQPPEAVPTLYQQVRVLALTVGSDEQENIQYVSYAASAGYVSEYNQGEFMEQLPHFRLPKLGPGTFRAFEIRGDSMPPIHDGYIVVGRFVEHARDLHDGKRYVFITRSAGVLFKQLVREARRPHRFMLVSDNPAYTPYSVDAADVVEAWELVTFIGSLAAYQDPATLLNTRLHAMEQKIDSLTHTST